LDSEAVYITKKILFAVLVMFSIAIFCANNLYATNDTQTINGTNLTNENVTTETSISSDLQSTLNSNETTENKSTNTVNSTTTSSLAAGDASGSEIHGVWLTANETLKLNSTDIDNLIKTGITDIFVKTNRISDPTYESVLSKILGLVNGRINIHAWITCFKDAEGNWVDPQGKYSYQVSIPYTEAVTSSYLQRYKGYYYKAYKAKVKHRYKVGKRWRYYYTYVTKYKRVYGWTYRTVYYTHYVTKYRTETRYDYDNTFKIQLISFINNIASNYNVTGIHLDYIRYSGSGDNAAYKNTGGTEAITSFVQKVRETVDAINNQNITGKSHIQLSAAVMPEGSENAKYYGQDYNQLSQYLDFIVPMIYKGNYNAGTAWIATTTKYIVNNSNGKPVIVGLLSYVSDDNVTPLSATELQKDINAALSNGASGYALFRYGLISSDFNSPHVNSSEYQLTFTLNEIKNAATRVKAFIETNHRLPEYVEISGMSITMPQFLEMLTTSVLQINNGKSTPISFENIDNPVNSTIKDTIYGNIELSEYMVMAERISSSINSNNTAPDYETSSLGNIGYKSLVYIYSKIMSFYDENSRLPSYVTVDSYITNPDAMPSELQQYLQETSNCQVSNSAIQSLAASIISGATSTYDRAVRIFNWVRDNIGYSFYYNTKYGAAGTLNARTGNCVDTTHILIALERAAGIPAKYMHGTCTFSSGSVYGHVWAQIWVNGQWYNADGTSSRNTFGVINNWNTNTVAMKGSYASLPF